jgi:hypothetical protein
LGFEAFVEMTYIYYSKLKREGNYWAFDLCDEIVKG